MIQFLNMQDKAAKQLAKIRAERETALAEIEATEHASLPECDIRARVAAMIDARVKEDVAERRAAELHVTRRDGARPRLREPDWAMLLMLLGRETVEQRLVDSALADMKARGIEPGLPTQEREDRIQALRTRVRNLEAAEIREMAALEDRGHIVLPRRDTDVELLLQIWGELGGGPPPEDSKDPGPAKRPEHLNAGAAVHAPVSPS